MKKLIQSTKTLNTEKIFSATDIMDLLNKIEELNNSDIYFSSTPHGSFDFVINDHVYEILNDDIQDYV